VIFISQEAVSLFVLSILALSFWDDLCHSFGFEPGEIGSTPSRMMMERPINEGDVKPDVPACFFTFDPFVTEYFRSLVAKCLIKPRFHETLRRTLRDTSCHKPYYLVELENFQVKKHSPLGNRTLTAQNRPATGFSNTPACRYEVYGFPSEKRWRMPAFETSKSKTRHEAP
jgi:hypothetical protein